jgi:hypothetical protein
MHRKRWIIVLASAFLIAATSIITCVRLSASQEAGTSQGSQPANTESSSTHKSKYSHANDLLIRGTVFDNRALSLRGATLRIRRAGEKKNRWETQANSRGEFAIRVPQGSDYEVSVEAKGFAKQSHEINAKNRNAEEKVIFHMEPVTGDKR